jgi:hypothetical protein
MAPVLLLLSGEVLMLMLACMHAHVVLLCTLQASTSKHGGAGALQ